MKRRSLGVIAGLTITLAACSTAGTGELSERLEELSASTTVATTAAPETTAAKTTLAEPTTTVEPTTTTVEPTTTTTEATTTEAPFTEPPLSGDEQFAMVFSLQAQEIVAASELSTEMVELMEDYDIGGAAINATMISVTFENLHERALVMPGVESAFGQQTLTALATCDAAYGAAAEALFAFDADAMTEAGEDVGHCGTLLSDATVALSEITAGL